MLREPFSRVISSLEREPAPPSERCTEHTILFFSTGINPGVPVLQHPETVDHEPVRCTVLPVESLAVDPTMIDTPSGPRPPKSTPAPAIVSASLFSPGSSSSHELPDYEGTARMQVRGCCPECLTLTLSYVSCQYALSTLLIKLDFTDVSPVYTSVPHPPFLSILCHKPPLGVLKTSTPGLGVSLSLGCFLHNDPPFS